MGRSSLIDTEIFLIFESPVQIVSPLIELKGIVTLQIAVTASAAFSPNIRSVMIDNSRERALLLQKTREITPYGIFMDRGFPRP